MMAWPFDRAHSEDWNMTGQPEPCRMAGTYQGCMCYPCDSRSLLQGLWERTGGRPASPLDAATPHPAARVPLDPEADHAIEADISTPRTSYQSHHPYIADLSIARQCRAGVFRHLGSRSTDCTRPNPAGELAGRRGEASRRRCAQRRSLVSDGQMIPL